MRLINDSIDGDSPNGGEEAGWIPTRRTAAKNRLRAGTSPTVGAGRYFHKTAGVGSHATAAEMVHEEGGGRA